jgi:hypothetical protein
MPKKEIRQSYSSNSQAPSPRSYAGKIRSRGNATRHGLGTRIAFDRQFAARTRGLAVQLAGASPGLITFESACVIAQAELDLERIRRLKVLAIEEDLARRGMSHVATISEKDAAAGQTALATAARTALPGLIKLERYERLAVARRDHAVRDVIARLLPS